MYGAHRYVRGAVMVGVEVARVLYGRATLRWHYKRLFVECTPGTPRIKHRSKCGARCRTQANMKGLKYLKCTAAAAVSLHTRPSCKTTPPPDSPDVFVAGCARDGRGRYRSHPCRDPQEGGAKDCGTCDRTQMEDAYCFIHSDGDNGRFGAVF